MPWEPPTKLLVKISPLLIAIAKPKALVPQMQGDQARFLRAVDFDQPTLSGSVPQQTLDQALDEYESAPSAKRKSMEPGIYQQIIRFRSKLAKNMDEDQRRALERRVAAYSNSLVKRK
jgi:hypothetical protein